LLPSLPVETYNLEAVRVHAHLAVEAMAKGRPRSACDMMIAATAAATTASCSRPMPRPGSTS